MALEHVHGRIYLSLCTASVPAATCCHVHVARGCLWPRPAPGRNGTAAETAACAWGWPASASLIGLSPWSKYPSGRPGRGLNKPTSTSVSAAASLNPLKTPQRVCPTLLVSFHSICGSLRCLTDTMQVGTPPTRLLMSSLAIQRCAMLCAICDSHHSHCRNPTARLQQNCCSGTRQCVHLVQGGRPQEEALAREEVQAAGKAGVGGAIPP